VTAIEVGLPLVSMRAIEDVVRSILGVPASLINTGGGCGAIEAKLEGGRYLLVTDGDVFEAFGPDVQCWYDSWTAVVYDDDEHAEPHEAGVGPAHDPGEGALRQAIHDALAAAAAGRRSA
jgi:hypothetical protein